MCIYIYTYIYIRIGLFRDSTGIFISFNLIQYSSDPIGVEAFSPPNGASHKRLSYPNFALQCSHVQVDWAQFFKGRIPLHQKPPP